jgi:hypothetical protein
MKRPSTRTGVIVAGVVLVGLAVLAFVGYGAGGAGTSPAAQLQAWNSGTQFGQGVGTLDADNARITKVLDNHAGTGAVHADCGVLITDAESANSNLPAPNDTLTDLLAKAYTLEGDAGYACYDAGATNRRLLAESLKDRQAAEGLFTRALTLMHTLGAGVVSTTTTTTPSDGGSIFG